MPKRNKGGRKRSGMRRGAGLSMTRSVIVPFRDVTTVQRTASAGYEITTINLNIASFASTTRVARLGALYEFYRFKRLKVRCVSDTTAVTIFTGASSIHAGYAHGVGFIPSASSDFTSPTDFTSLVQFPQSKMSSSHQPVSISMGPAALYGSTPTKWYHTTSTGTPPTADSSVGSVVYVTRTALTQASQQTYSYIELEGVVEFKAPIAGGSSLSYTTTIGEERKLRIAIPDENIDYYHPRTSVRDDVSNGASSVPNTPRSVSSSVPTGTYEGQMLRSDRNQFDRPRLVRQ